MTDAILIPTDGSKDAEKGVEQGIELAAEVGAKVHALYVVEEGGNPWLSESMDEQMDRAKEYGQDILDDVTEEAEAAGVECETAVEASPSVHGEVNEYVEENDIDMIVMGSGYRGKFGGMLGSTAEKVLRSAEVPVTTIRRGELE
jgi:nucleotide-binding universal stress UspA family protein